MEATDTPMDAAAVRRALYAAHLRPNRALGQNFCTDGARLAAMADAAAADGLPVLEIGPGLGALTEPLLLRAPRVVAVEKDAALCAALRARLCAHERAGRLALYAADILRFDVPGAMDGAPFAAAGNLPYYITTPIAEYLLPLLPSSLTLMVQREAGERFFAGPGARVYGPLSVLTQLYYEPERLMDVPRGCFYPQPEVDSLVVRLARRRGAPPEAPQRVLAFCRRAFSMRRKTLLNNLLPAGRPAPQGKSGGSAAAGARPAPHRDGDPAGHAARPSASGKPPAGRDAAAAARDDARAMQAAAAAALAALRLRSDVRAEALAPEDLLALLRLLPG